MQVRYQAALRPEADQYSRLGSVLAAGFGFQQSQRGQQIGPQGRKINRLIGRLKVATSVVGRLQIEISVAAGQVAGQSVAPATILGGLAKPVAGAADRETLFIEKITNPSDKQHLVMLVIAPVAPPLHRAQLRELLFPIAQHVRLDATQFTDLTDREIALGRYRRERFSQI